MGRDIQVKRSYLPLPSVSFTADLSSAPKHQGQWSDVPKFNLMQCNLLNFKVSESDPSSMSIKKKKITHVHNQVTTKHHEINKILNDGITDQGEFSTRRYSAVKGLLRDVRVDYLGKPVSSII